MHDEGMNSLLRSCRAGVVAVSVAAMMGVVAPAVTASAATGSPVVGSAVPWTVDKGRVVVTVKKRAPKAKVLMTQPVTVLMTDSGLSAAALTCKAKGKAVTVKRAKKKTRKKLRRSCRTTIQRHVAATQQQPSVSPGDVQQMSPVAGDPGMAGFSGEWTYDNMWRCYALSTTMGNNELCKELLLSHVDLVITDPDPNYATCNRYGAALWAIHVNSEAMRFVAEDEYDAIVTCRRLDTAHDGMWEVFFYGKGAAKYLSSQSEVHMLDVYKADSLNWDGVLPPSVRKFVRPDCSSVVGTNVRLASDPIPTLAGFRQYLTRYYTPLQQTVFINDHLFDGGEGWESAEHRIETELVRR